MRQCVRGPGDILARPQGLTVEIDNTDAEGRLILRTRWRGPAKASGNLPDRFRDADGGGGAVALARISHDATLMNDAPRADVLGRVEASGDPVWRHAALGIRTCQT